MVVPYETTYYVFNLAVVWQASLVLQAALVFQGNVILLVHLVNLNGKWKVSNGHYINLDPMPNLVL